MRLVAGVGGKMYILLLRKEWLKSGKSVLLLKEWKGRKGVWRNVVEGVWDRPTAGGRGV